MPNVIIGKEGAFSKGFFFTDEPTQNIDLANASFSGTSFGVGSEDGSPQGLVFNGDGTKMFVVGAGSSSVYEYDLSTSFDISTATYNNVSFDVSGQDTIPTGMSFSDDGTKMFVAGTANDSVYEYDLSTGFDLSTASYNNVSFDVSGQTGPTGVTFNGDGTKMFVVGSSSDSIYEYDLTTGFDLSTASYNNVSFDVSGQDGSSQGMAFNSDGTKMFLAGDGNDNVYEYTLSTRFDLSTASYNSVSFSVGTQDGTTSGVTFNSDGTKMFVSGVANDRVYEYTL